MLIDILSFVRQLLPPNRREPVQIGIAKVLLSPLTTFLQRVEDWVFFATIDAGTPGQVGVLEYVLQTYVSPYIFITTASGRVYDFRVLIPEGTTTDEIGQIKGYVDRWNLAGMRYEVTSLIDWEASAGLDPVEWEPLPSIVPYGSNYSIQWGVSRVGKFFTRITHVETEISYVASYIQYLGSPISATVPIGGAYIVSVGELSYEITTGAVVEVTDRPVWLNRMGLTYSAPSHEMSLWLDATGDTDSKIRATVDPQPNGLDHALNPWNSNTWNSNTTDFVREGYTEVGRYNPVSSGVGGIMPGVTYEFRVRLVSNPLEVFVFTYTMPTSSVLDILTIVEAGEGPVDPELSYEPFFLDRSPADQFNLIITGEPGAWVLNDGPTPNFPLHGGYGFRYLFNGELVPTFGNLSNHPWNSNEPLFIIKEHYKLSCSPTDPRVNEWIYNCAPDYLIAPFEAYNLGAFCNVMFKRTGTAPESEFVPVVPDWYVPDKFYAVTPEQAPDVDPLPGVIFGTRPFNGRHTQDDMFPKGWTHASHSAISRDTSPPNSRKYHDAVRTLDIFPAIPHYVTEGEGPIGLRRVYTEAAVRARAREFQAYPIFVGESVENRDWDPQPQYMTWFLDELKEAAIEEGFTNFKSTRNYFWGFSPDVFTGDPWAHLDMSGINSLRVLFQYPVSEWNARFPAYYAQISSTYKTGLENMSLEGWYEKPNMSGSVKKYMRLLYSLIIGKKFLDSVGANNATGVTLRAGYEVTGYDTEDPTLIAGGHLVSKGNFGICGNEQAAIAFVSIWFGKAFFHWHNNFGGNTNPANRFNWTGDNRHYFINSSGGLVGPAGAPDKKVPGFPYWTGEDYYATWGPHSYFDFGYFGYHMAHACKETMGGAEKWASFRVDGGSWTTLTADDAEPLNAALRNGGVVRFRKLGDWVTWWYWNPIGANANKTIEVKDPDNPATIYTGTIFGNKVHLKHFEV